jgi:transcriptional regulator with XRE-family HTH domain
MSKRRGANEGGHMEVPSDRAVFARNFRNARKKAGLTQIQIHNLTGFAQAFISKVETGKSTISLDNMIVLAKAVDTPLWRLLIPDGEQ